MWTPNVDLGRDPRWGRTEECYGEDAFLTSRLAVAFIKGIQEIILNTGEMLHL